jgi:hypothetical protein
MRLCVIGGRIGAMLADPQGPVQPPAAHEVVHAPVVAHTNVQPPAWQSNAQLASPRQVILHPPPVQLYMQLALPSQVWWQPPASHTASHAPCETHESQLPRGQLAVQTSPPVHVCAGPVSGSAASAGPTVQSSVQPASASAKATHACTSSRRIVPCVVDPRIPER